MEIEMVYASMIYYFCLFMLVLVGIIGGGVFIEKRVSHSSWFRNIFAVIAGIGISVMGLLIVYAIGGFLFFSNRSSLSLIYGSVFVAVVLVSMLGGYIGGKVARRNEIVYGFLIGFGLLLLSVGVGDSYFIERQIDKLVLVFMQAARFCATVAGSYIALFQRERNQAHVTPIVKPE